MERRGFLVAVFSAAMAPAVVKASSLMRIAAPTILAPPFGLWTQAAVTREMLSITENMLTFSAAVNQDWQEQFDRNMMAGDQWSAQERSTILIRKPQRYALNRRRASDG